MAFLAPLILNTVKKATWLFHKIEKLLNCWILKISNSDIAKSNDFLVEVIFNNRFTTTYIKYQEALKRTRIGDLLILSVTLAVIVDNPQTYADWKSSKLKVASNFVITHIIITWLNDQYVIPFLTILTKTTLLYKIIRLKEP